MSEADLHSGLWSEGCTLLNVESFRGKGSRHCPRTGEMRSQMHPSAQDTPSYSLTEPSFSESLCIRIPLFTPSCGLIHAAPFPPTSQAVVCCLLLAHVSPWTLALLPRPPGCAQPPCCLAKGTSSADTEGRPASQPHTSSRSPPSAAAPAPPALPSSLTILGTHLPLSPPPRASCALAVHCALHPSPRLGSGPQAGC